MKYAYEIEFGNRYINEYMYRYMDNFHAITLSILTMHTFE